MKRADQADSRMESPSSILAELVDRLTARVQAGEPIDWSEVARQHPEHVGDLRELWPALGALDDLSQSGAGEVSGIAPAADGDGCVSGVLGDYRILREVGRGGMGVVYLAEQISLRRRVALKVLPLAGILDERRLRRFHNEAQAAACLHHEHIVPVHAVGSERGVHFYAMQFIDGQSLAEAIRQLRQGGDAASEGRTTPYQVAPGGEAAAAATEPAARQSTLASDSGKRDRAYYRRVAELGVQAAEALDHAHQMGIVHRDVKPANLLVDGRGQLWVTDFGLAHVQHGEAGLTMTGDLVGTLRYMSPEQALAKRVVIDHRTDVYSLGATLYELLTLEPAFAGQDRQELLRQIAFEEPAAPRKVERSIPAELETIVLKALEKNPADRYATAGEVAADLRRWLEDRPIKARRPSLTLRLGRLARRHRAVVLTAGLGLVVALGVLAGCVGWVAGERRARRAEVGRSIEAALDDAGQWLKKNRPYEALSAALRAEGLVRHAGGHPELQPRVEEMLGGVRLLLRLEAARISGSAVRDGHFDHAAADEEYEKAFKEHGLDLLGMDAAQAARHIQGMAVRAALIDFLDDWAVTRRGARGKEDPGWGKLVQVSQLAEPDESRRRVRETLLSGDWKTLERLAGSGALESWPTGALGAIDTTKGTSLQLVELLRKAQRARPDDFWLNHSLARALEQAKPEWLEEAIGFYRAAVALRPQSPGLLLNLGAALNAKGKLDEAIDCYRQAIRLKPDFASVHNNLGVALADKGKVDEAIACYRQAISLQRDFAQVHNNLGNALKAKGKVDEAIAEFRKALQLGQDNPHTHNNLGNALWARGQHDKAIASYRQAIRLKPDYALAHTNLGAALEQKGMLDEAFAECRKALQLEQTDPLIHYNFGHALMSRGQYDEAIACYRQAIRLKPDYAEAHCNLGMALVKKGKVDEAIASFKEAISHKPALAEAHGNLGTALAKKGKVEEAIPCFRQAIRLKPDHAETHGNLGYALHRKGKPEEAIACFRQVIRLKPDFAEAHCQLGVVLQSQGRFEEALVALRRGHVLGSKRPGWSYPSGRGVREAERRVELDAKLPAVLRGEIRPANASEAAQLALLCLSFKRRPAAAARLYQETFSADPKLALHLDLGHRYNAACAAALAGCGQGEDAGTLGAMDRLHWRRQALTWLRADLRAWRHLLDRDPLKARPAVAKQMQHWLADPDFSVVRGPDALGRLSPEERAAWARLWADVSALAARTKDLVPGGKEKPDNP